MTSFLNYLGNKNLDGRTDGRKDGRKDGGHFYSPPLGRGTNNNNNNNNHYHYLKRVTQSNGLDANVHAARSAPTK